MSKPHVICHMMTSLDGKILTANWGRSETIKTLKRAYEKIHDSFGSDAWICGRVTMEKDFANGKKADVKRTNKKLPRTDHVADKEATTFAVAVDASGKLYWNNSSISGDHIIEVLTEKVTDSYLAYLQEKGISYIFAGKEELNFTVVLNKLGKLFPIKILMLEGGGHLNGSFLNAGLIDEISLLLAPIADGTPKATTMMEVGDYLKKKSASLMQLEDVQKMEDSIVWLRYRGKKK